MKIVKKSRHKSWFCASVWFFLHSAVRLVIALIIGFYSITRYPKNTKKTPSTPMWVQPPSVTVNCFTVKIYCFYFQRSVKPLTCDNTFLLKVFPRLFGVLIRHSIMISIDCDTHVYHKGPPKVTNKQRFPWLAMVYQHHFSINFCLTTLKSSSTSKTVGVLISARKKTNQSAKPEQIKFSLRRLWLTDPLPGTQKVPRSIPVARQCLKVKYMLCIMNELSGTNNTSSADKAKARMMKIVK